MTTDRASAIRREVDQLIDLQLATLKKEASLTPAELRDYHLRSEKIQTLYSELDRIEQPKPAAKFAHAS